MKEVVWATKICAIRESKRVSKRVIFEGRDVSHKALC